MTLGITRRQIDRLILAYKEKGKEAFVHGNRGRRPVTAIPEKTKKDILDLYRLKYPDTNFTHFTELLARVEGTRISVSAVSSILEEAGILSPRGTKAKKKRITQQLKKGRSPPRQRRKPCRYRKTSSPLKMPTPDVPDAVISAKWNKWTPHPIPGLAAQRPPSISPWMTPPVG